MRQTGLTAENRYDSLNAGRRATFPRLLNWLFNCHCFFAGRFAKLSFGRSKESGNDFPMEMVRTNCTLNKTFCTDVKIVGLIIVSMLFRIYYLRVAMQMLDNLYIINA